ncbi:Serralysin B [Ephemeroptericola cinctiostellae]|uniref:Serralysin B n=1 Tax=Ephemeroptericola cinctiostellae TaxID=2268024 RepID=A0A345DA26_9BURK|nr:FG-GAP-like repeat-containing protein [Ephemeroptericola cinctiostellae]AXF85214.1 Serralysin B [Ephemeroptericola cinctiostellae]
MTQKKKFRILQDKKELKKQNAHTSVIQVPVKSFSSQSITFNHAVSTNPTTIPTEITPYTPTGSIANAVTTAYAGGGNGLINSRAAVSSFALSDLTNTPIEAQDLINDSPAKWGSGLGQGINLTYSFYQTGTPVYYVLSNNQVVQTTTPQNTSIFSTMNSTQQAVAKNVMGVYAAVSNVTFSETSDNASGAGDIRWMNVSGSVVSTAASIGPSSSAYSGDIWMGGASDYEYNAYRNPYDASSNSSGNAWGRTTFIHELGHALGLQHPHDTAVSVSTQFDQLKYSVMSYKDYESAPLVHRAEYSPTTLMLNDIVAIQKMYGVNTAYKTDNNTYMWDGNSSIFETIYDAGGYDTINASNQTQGVKINLNAGQWSEIGKTFNRGDGTLVRDCLTIAYGCTIENAIGSNLNDTLIGNDVSNSLFGGRGDDALNGAAGNDTLDGGFGSNSLIGGTGNDTYILNSSLASGFQIQRWETKSGVFVDTQKWATGDFNGDGKADVVNIFNDSGSMSADIHISNGTGFKIQRAETKAGGFWDTQKWATGDFNGDGKADLVNVFNDNGLMSADVHLSNGTSFQAQRWETKAGGFWDAQKWVTGDFNGDGKADLVNVFNDNGLMSADVHLSNGTSFQAQRWETKAGSFWDTQKWLSADVNGDGKADLINIFNDNGSTSVDVHISTGTGFQIQRWETKAGGFWDAQQWSAADVDGDGKADLINAFSDDGLMSADVHISTGSGFQIQRWETKAGGFWDGQKWAAADLTGDGKADLINVFSDLGSTSIDVHIAGSYLSKSDSIIETQGEGTDTVIVDNNYTLGNNVENVTLTRNQANNITGNSLNNTLKGNASNNILAGLLGNDTLQGDLGNDTYLFQRGAGIDNITESDTTSNNTDLLWFDTSATSNQLWFQHTGNNLVVSVIGTNDNVTINNWYSGVANQIEQIKASDGKVLLNNEVEALVSVMSAFTIPAMGVTTLPTNYQTALNPVLAANWS